MVGIRELLHDVSLKEEVLNIRQGDLGLALLDGNDSLARKLTNIASNDGFVHSTCTLCKANLTRLEGNDRILQSQSPP
jgi:hypothetical protein